MARIFEAHHDDRAVRTSLEQAGKLLPIRSNNSAQRQRAGAGFATSKTNDYLPIFGFGRKRGHVDVEADSLGSVLIKREFGRRLYGDI